ncbi:PIN domain-containing protein [Calothrix sp. HK-06]|nr:PIN domain-containing protein [Calothrix sp. HK-06]
MKIYVETNFVFEIVFEQEQFASCEQILQLIEAGRIQLIVPAYSLAEPHEKLIRQARKRIEIQQAIDTELKQLLRTASYQTRFNSTDNVSNLLLQSIQDEKHRFSQYRDRFLKCAEIIPMNADVMRDAATNEVALKFQPQDAIIYASVMFHLRQNPPQIACFINRNARDFHNPITNNDLNRFNCRMIPSFDDGYNFIQSRIR